MLSQILFTLGIAFGVILVALLLLGIGWIITGKPRLKIGMCGKAPDKKGSCGKDTSCGVCGRSDEKDKDGIADD